MAESHCNQVKFTDADVVNPDDWSFGNYKPFLLHDHGFVLAVVFADHLQDAIDEAADSGKLDQFLVGEKEMVDYPNEEGLSFLGNNCKAYDIENVDAIELKKPEFSFCALYNAASPMTSINR